MSSETFGPFDRDKLLVIVDLKQLQILQDLETKLNNIYTNWHKHNIKRNTMFYIFVQNFQEKHRNHFF